MVKKNTLIRDMMEITVGAAIAGPTISIIEASPIPQPIRGATSSLVGVKLLSETGKKIN